MKKTDILIVGGGPAGLISAIMARSHYPNKNITLVRDKEKSLVPCGIPYIFNRLDSVDKNIMPDKPLQDNKIDLLIDRILKINSEKKKVYLENKEAISYEKLILANGSKPNKIPVEGLNKEGVFVVEKDFDYLKKMREKVLQSRNIVIVGGGFIGMELAEEISSIEGVKVSIIEREGLCLEVAFDKEFCLLAEEKLKSKGVVFYKNKNLKEIVGKNKVEGVLTDIEEKIKADMVILSVGSSPDISLANAAGIEAGKGGVKVNEYMQTSDKDIFAAGDCAETKILATKEYKPVMLASTACTEARIVASNLYELKNKNCGTLGVFSTYLGGLVLGACGLTENEARNNKINVLIGECDCPNHHPSTLPNTENVKTKLIFSKEDEKLIGGEIMGPESVAELINIIACAVQKETVIDDLITMQFATHPLLTAAPTVYPLIKAAQIALKNYGE